MADKPKKPQKLRARLPRGLEDRGPAAIAATRAMTDKIREVYERYGFEPVETPAMEFTDALGKFLPDQDRPNEGVFSFQDDDEQWISLRYDLTAPLARYVGERYGTESLVLPYRSYRHGWVFRNEKPGPGRFRQFMQFDADTVGSASPAADAEMCMMAADTMDKLDIPRGAYIVKVSNRKVLDGVLEAIGLGGDDNFSRRLIVLRAIDKFDRLGVEGVVQLLKEGRKDTSGDFTKGAGLSDEQVEPLIRLLNFNKIYDAIQRGEFNEIDTQFPNPYVHPPATWRGDAFGARASLIQRKALELRDINPAGRSFDRSLGIDLLGYAALMFDMNKTLAAGLNELADIEYLFQAAGYVRTLRQSDPLSFLEEKDEAPRVAVDLTVVRGLEYYTGPVFEVELFAAEDDGRPIRFGSVGGGGRYDGLVSRFRGEPVPATGFSIGVSRLLAALEMLGKLDTKREVGPVVVTVFDRDRVADYQKMVADLRNAGIRAELYLGNPKNMGNQLKYADRRGSPCVVIQGGDELNDPEGPQLIVKDLLVGSTVTDVEKDRDRYLQTHRAIQQKVPVSKLVITVQQLLNWHEISHGNNHKP